MSGSYNLPVDSPHPYRPPADLSRFFVVTPISNPVRYQRRYELYARFRDMCLSAGVQLITVEQAFGERPYMVTDPTNRFHVQVRSLEELWFKEGMINTGTERAAELGATKIAWVDADTFPMQPPRRWFEEIWHALQHYEFVQCFGTMQDVDSNQEAIGAPQPSFMYNYIKYGTPTPEEFIAHRNTYPYGHNAFGRPGLAWAANVDALDKVGRLIDYAILGSGDWFMAHCLIGGLGTILKESPDQPFISRMFQWQTLCERWIKRDVGYVPGTLWHDWHGDKKNRGYNTRDKILLDAHFNPDTDLKYDAYGLLQLETWEPRQIKLRDDIRAYFRARSEDALS